jgi:hypothetical protein
MTAPGKSTNQLDPFIDYTDLPIIDARDYRAIVNTEWR